MSRPATPQRSPDPESALPTETTALLGSSQDSNQSSSSSTLDGTPEAAGAALASDGTGSDSQGKASASVLKVVLILLIGAFTANADGSLVLATHPTIASEFNALSESSWLFVAFNLAGAATQAMYGKLSDIYGRRALLIIAYALFAIGCAFVGVGYSMGQVILGRVISGCGGSALNVLAMLLITDLVPIRDAATWQSGLNLAATTGRSLGGPVGGWLADTIGWRWSFMGQVPIFLLAIVLSILFLPGNTHVAGQPQSPTGENAEPAKKSGALLARIDFLGALFLALTILALLLPLQIGGIKVPWTHPIIFVLLASGVIFGFLFAATEEWWAKEPIFPLTLFRHRDIVLAYTLSVAQVGAQLGLMFAVPLYFQVTQRVSNTVAGAYLFPAVAGNAVGAIIAGIVIKRTGRYKNLLVVATIVSASAYLLLLLRWHGNTNVWEALYILPGGLGMGMAQSGLFVAVQAAAGPSNKGPALGGIWLTGSIGAMLGMAAVSAVTILTMKVDLAARLSTMGFDGLLKQQIIQEASSSVDYIDQADKAVSVAIVASYVKGLEAGHIVSLACSSVAILSAIFLREHKL